jgi:quercetin dioxygenase-like cupin family protein
MKAMFDAEAAKRWAPALADRIAARGRVEGTTLHVFDVEAPPGGGVPPHTHPSPEIFRVLSGRLTMTLGDAEVTAEAGDVVTVPPWAPHAYRNDGPETAMFMVVVDEDMAAMFAELAQLGPVAGPPSAALMARVAAIAGAHGVAFVGQD